MIAMMIVMTAAEIVTTIAVMITMIAMTAAGHHADLATMIDTKALLQGEAAVIAMMITTIMMTVAAAVIAMMNLVAVAVTDTMNLVVAAAIDMMTGTDAEATLVLQAAQEMHWIASWAINVKMRGGFGFPMEEFASVAI
mmetsp:Transcript_37636/g.66936  ORF Transcript_37636/g.66936 Transcript_37636/m.66936 type:complete len:139 (-) Transcript_37636:114-530(-)